MKFEIPDNDIMTVGALKTKAITITANAKAYRLIFGQIYPDIIKAIVRELFTNAWDSQKVAGTLQTPIDIHLPTEFEPYFSIRDYGTGMTPEIIDDVYTRVFESTKDDSNDEAGMFGMGSKTPLGYTDSFSITSYVNGRMWAYNIYINAHGEAELALQYEGDTVEPNGVFVQVGVNRSDFDNFQNHAETFALHAGTPININKKRFLNSRNVLMAGENWTLYEDNDKYENAMFIRMGCVLYRVNVSMMFSNLEHGYQDLDYNERVYVRDLFNMPLVLDFPIGTFDVTGSREDIIYNGTSSNLIYNRVVKDVVKEITNNIAVDINQAKTVGEAYRRAFSFKNLKLIMDGNLGFNNLKWKSWPIRKVSTLINERTRTRFAFNPYNRRSDSLIRSFTSSRIDPIMLYDPDAITYVVIDNGNVKRAYSRLSNLIDCLRSAGLKRNTPYQSSIYRSGKPPAYNLLWVHEKMNLKRLSCVLPEKHIIVNLEDIMVTPPKARIPREELDVDYRVYHIYERDGILKPTTYVSEPHSDYFVRSHRRKLVDKEENIRTACAALQLEVENVAVINKMSEESIDHYGLKDLFEEAEKVRNNITYNESTIFYHAMREFYYTFGNSTIKSMFSAKETVAKWIGVDYNSDDVVSSYMMDVNVTVADQHEAMKTLIQSKVDELCTKHEIIHYVHAYHLGDNEKLTNILRILGEIK